MSAAKQVHIIQGTPQWHDWRRNGVGASDVAALFGKSPYKTKRDLWFEKAGLGNPDDEDRSFIFKRGHEVEAELRELFSKHIKAEINPACFEKDEIFLVSLDGYEKSVGLFEAKFIGKEALKKAHDYGEIPEHHWIQIQSQLHGSDSDKGYWGGRAPNIKNPVVVEIGRDDKFIKLIRNEVEDFWEQLATHQIPNLTERDWLFISDPDQTALFNSWAILKRQLKTLEMELAIYESQVKDLASHARVRCGSVTITESIRQGAVDYLKIPAVAAMTEAQLDLYRKPDSKPIKTIRLKEEF